MRATTLLAAALLFCAPAAAHAAVGPDPDPAPAAPAQAEAEARSKEVTVRVDNQSWQSVRVYVVLNGGRRPLGRVGSGERRDFRLPEGGSAGRVHLLATWTPRDGVVTEPFTLTPGTQLEWRLLDAPGGIPRSAQLLFH